MSRTLAAILVTVLCSTRVSGLATSNGQKVASRREALGWFAGVAIGAGASVGLPQSAMADSSLDVDDFLKRGQVAQPMGVSGQAGKSKPETGVFLRDGSEVSRDSRSGDVLAEILLQSNDSTGNAAFLAGFSSPWPLAKGTVFDVECRDAKTGDGAFLAVTKSVGGKAIADLKDSFFLDDLFSSTGRFSFYGSPTDVKVKKSATQGDARIIDVTFSTLSQSTQTEIPRRARLVATIPEGAAQAVMLVGSSSANRWKGSETLISSTIDSFRATPAPKTSLKIRAKERRGAL